MSKATFADIKNRLSKGTCEIHFTSLISGREIVGTYRDAGVNQSESDKILCIDTVSESYEDIQIDTIKYIKNLF
jgi:hypothetical protein